ncbi:MAG: PAS domain-containing protein [Geopsychrobacter sp.]|nr:PAS domain-containing protein [Geopsychrobacter sp.]
MKKRPDGYAGFPRVERRSVERLDSRCQDVDWLRSSLPQLSPQRLIRLMAISIFVAEAIIMLVLANIPELPIYYEALIDSAALLIVLSPTFYFFHYRPMLSQYRDRKGIVEQLWQSEERLNLAVNAVNDGIWDWDIQTGDVYASERLLAMLDFAPGVMGRKISFWEERLHVEEQSEIARQLREHLDGQSDYFCTEHRLRKRTGDYVWVLARGRVVRRGSKGNALRMVGTYNDITLRKLAEEALRCSEEDIRTLSRMMMHSSEEEKRHLAQDLHDEFGQVLCAFRLGVEMLRDRESGTRDAYLGDCNRLVRMVDRLEVDLRHMCDHLRPVMLDDLGLIPALKWLLGQYAEQNPDVSTHFNGENLKLALSQEKEIALYRICQEALNNVGKYAQADQVTLGLNTLEGDLVVSICDNGVGFKEDKIGRRPGGWGMGLLGMQERISAIGGDMLINSAPSTGTQIRVVLPLSLVGEVLFEEISA